jgi:hypothetical protein
MSDTPRFWRGKDWAIPFRVNPREQTFEECFVYFSKTFNPFVRGGPVLENSPLPYTPLIEEGDITMSNYLMCLN